MSNFQNLKRFAREYVKPRRGMFLFVQLLQVASTLLLLVPPLLVRRVIDVYIPGGDTLGVVWSGLGIVGISAFFFVASGLKSYWGHEVAQDITASLRNDLYGHFQKLSMRFHDRERTGGLISRIVDDMNVIQEVVHHGPEAIVGTVFMVGGSAALMLWLNWKLALVGMAVVPLLVIFAHVVGGRMWRGFRDVRTRKASLSDEIEENLAGIQVIKAYGAEGREHRSVTRENAEHYTSRMKVIRYMSVLFPGAMFINNFGLAAVVTMGGWLAIRGPVEVGLLTAFIMYMRQFLHPIMRVVMMLEHAGRFFASIERFFEYMDIAPEIVDRPDARAIDSINGEVVFENVTFSYEDETILKEVSFTARPGQMVAFVGPSGAGKTTVTRLIPRFYDPDDGRITLDGVDLRDIALNSLRDKIGMVLQDDFLFSGSVADNIAYSRPDATREEIVDAAHRSGADEFVDRLPDGFDTEIGKRGVKLSEGQRQRLSIARAILKNPPILLLDEATSSVDAATELKIQRAIEQLREGRTTFAIAHRLSTIFAADQILFIEDGRVVERGTHHELIARGGPYAGFFEIQFKEVVEV